MKKPAKMNHMLYTALLMMAASWGLGLMATLISPSVGEEAEQEQQQCKSSPVAARMTMW
jgi:hypothetical protein